MKTKAPLILIVLLPLFAGTFLSWRKTPTTIANNKVPLWNQPMTMCGAASLGWDDVTNLAPPEILQGLGDVHYPISTKSEKAQAFFDQGIRLVYAFNHWEAIRAFKETIRIDPENAMGYWGLALAFGPNLNDWNPQDRERLAFNAIQEALAKSGKANQTEKDAITALATRYNGKSYQVRDSLNTAYATAMEKLAAKYPEHADIQTLCVDAIMNTMPWNYWYHNGEAKAETKKAKSILEAALKKFPTHAGAHHLYIHLVEASSTPELALNSANFLETAMPGAGHIVHMPAHIYIRTGMYDRSIASNIKAVSVDEQYLSYSENQGMYRLMYYPHNVDFIGYSAYMEGRSELGIQTALKLAYKSSFTQESSPGFSQYLTVEPMIAYVRFGKWGELLALPDPDYEILYAQIMWRFSRGIAFIRTGYTQQAKFELSKLDSLNSLDTLKSIYITFNPVSSSSNIATNILRGEIALKENKFDAAISSFKKAQGLEDSLMYNEPPDWKIPTRHYLGAALMEGGNFVDAEKVYLDDLKTNRENGWALTGLHQSYIKQGKKKEAGTTSKRLAKAWKNADVRITSSRY